MKKILILGATGFIGTNLLHFYKNKKGYQVYATYRSAKTKINKVKWLKADLRNPKIVNKIIKGKDIVIQAAATTSGAKDIVNTPQLHVTDNAIMNSYIFRSCFENNVKHAIFFSCTVMYPHTKTKLKESKNIINNQIISKYFGVAQTKLYVENICKFYSKIGNTKFTCIRHSNVFGPNDKFDINKGHFFAANLMKIEKTKNNRITIWGKGSEKRDLIYIDDLIRFVNLTILKQRSKYEIYNCGGGKAFKVLDVIKKIIFHSKKKIIVDLDLSKPTIKADILINISKAKNDLGWRPKFSLDRGILETMKWYKDNV